MDNFRQVATTASSHTVLTPPAMSNIPPMAPPTPPGVPAPFPYAGHSGTAGGTASKLKIGGGEAMTEGSSIDVDPPGNQPSQPAPIHDLVTMQVCAKFFF
jgi:hypothetical protein